MGGNAFCAMLSSAAFPRLPPAVYRALKSDMLTKISEFYDCVGVPPEAPEKADYGDVDYLVTSPKAGYGSFVPHEIIKQALNARYVNAMDGNRTSNYAVPVKYGQWMDLAHGPEEIEKRSATEDGQIYYQVCDLRILLHCPNELFLLRSTFMSAWTWMNTTESCSSTPTAISALS